MTDAREAIASHPLLRGWLPVRAPPFGNNRDADMPTPADNLRINGERLWGTIHEIAEIGPGVRGGNNRQTLTDADRDGRLLFKRWCEDAGLTVGVDSMGTMF